MPDLLSFSCPRRNNKSMLLPLSCAKYITLGSRCFFYFLVAYELPVCLVHTRSSIHFSVPSFSLCHFECSDRLIVSILDRILVEISCRDTSYLRRNLLGQKYKSIGSNFYASKLFFSTFNFSPLSSKKNIWKKWPSKRTYNGEIREKFYSYNEHRGEKLRETTDLYAYIYMFCN